MIDDTFTLKGRSGPIFRVVRFLNAFGIPCVYGRTFNNTLQTTARLDDIDASPELIERGRREIAERRARTVK